MNKIKRVIYLLTAACILSCAPAATQATDSDSEKSTAEEKVPEPIRIGESRSDDTFRLLLLKTPSEGDVFNKPRIILNEDSVTEMNPPLTMLDGISVNSQKYIAPVGEVRNMIAIELILGCMDAGLSRDYCQCSVDNTFETMSATDIFNFTKGKTELSEALVDETQQYCAEEPKSKIPTMLDMVQTTAGELRSYLEKELMLDCVTLGINEPSCRCISQDMALTTTSSLDIDVVVAYLRIADKREANIMQVIPQGTDAQNEALREQVLTIYQGCALGERE